ncbi:MAG TPA: hypothetical protein DEB56_12830 [Thiobacillus sp.]|nr:hypothetical protein [Thiobacillus sp.]
MELKDLLALENPTLEQFAETEKLLAAAIDSEKAEIARLDAEDKARAIDRVKGLDDGRTDRMAARAAAESRLDDLVAVQQDTGAKAAALEARLEKEADDRAWNETATHLNRRSALLLECEKALDKAAELYADSEAAFKDARKAAPVAMPGGILVNTQGGAPGMIGVAVMGRLHALIGRPMAVHNIEARGQFSVFEREGLAGLADYAQPTANLLMSGQHGG